jgi:hypothetical protein
MPIWAFLCCAGNGSERKTNRIPKTPKAYFDQVLLGACLVLNPKDGDSVFQCKIGYFNRVYTTSRARTQYAPLSVSYRMFAYETDGIATGLDGPRSFPTVTRFLFAIARRLALEPIQTTIQWVPAASSLGLSDRGVKLTTHHHLVPRSRMMEPRLHSPYVSMAYCTRTT